MLTYEGSDYTVIVEYGPKAGIPEGAELTVEEIPQDSEAYQEYYQKALEAVNAQDADTTAADEAETAAEENISKTLAFDIRILVNGEKIKPSAPVKVSVVYTTDVEIPEGARQAIHFADNGEVEVLEAAVPKVKNVVENDGIADTKEQDTVETDAESIFSFEQNTFSVTVVSVAEYAARESGGVSTWEELVTAFNTANSGDTVRLDGDFSADQGLTIGEGKNIKLDLNGHTIKTSDANTGGFTLFSISDGGMLTIMDSAPATEEVVDSSTGETKETIEMHTVSKGGKIIDAVSSNNSPLIRVEGGTFRLGSGMITGAKGRAIYAENSSAITLAGGYICGNINGDTEGRGSNNGGGAIYLSGGAVATMSGGYITNNVSKPAVYFDGGGGIMMQGGNTHFTLSDGYITGNYSASGGGGLFCANGANLTIENVLVENNGAGGFGGGVAGCSTGRVIAFPENGAAIFGNRADGQNTSGDGSEKPEDNTLAKRRLR